jgi:iron complex outermembrane receptor protein
MDRQQTTGTTVRAQPCRRAVLGTMALLAVCGPGLSAAAGGVTPSELGTVLVTAKRLTVGEVGPDQVASVVTQEEMREFNRDNVGDALNLLSGVTLSTNSRNEKMIAIRGFDSRQVPLFMDGVPVYVPYDGYVDFSRFTTADLAAIQVAKGFSSLAYGPNTLGGAINLISRRPTARFEADGRMSAGAGEERQLALNLGTRQAQWYLQAGVSRAEADDFRLSSDFVPTATENGGSRENSARRDDKVSFKLGWTPRLDDEYVLSYYRQDGEKGQPPSTIPADARYWKWPYWDKEGIALFTNTALGDKESLKLRLYADDYGNEVNSYTDASYTTLKTSGRGSVGTGRSIYDDRAKGASLALESVRLAANTIRLLASYRTDEHREKDANGVQNSHFDDELVSYGLEDNIQLAPAWLLSLGISRDELRPEAVYSAGNAYSLPDSKDATNVQAGLFHDWSDRTRFYATVARKSRLPTLKDRYSQRLGTYIENPDLQPEESLNYEIGYQGLVGESIRTEAAVFYSDVDDKIQSVANVSGNLSQMQNLGKVRISGLELAMHDQLSARLAAGFSFTLIDRDNRATATRLTDVPRQKLSLDARFQPANDIDLIAWLEANSSRWVSDTTRLAGFATTNLKAVWRATPQLAAEAGASNVFDKDYALADGFPSAGRMWFAGASYQF